MPGNAREVGVAVAQQEDLFVRSRHLKGLEWFVGNKREI